jgi:flavin-dependent dehydrogenase
MKSGMLAAEAVFARAKSSGVDSLPGAEVKEYESNLMDSWVAKELKVSYVYIYAHTYVLTYY